MAPASKTREATDGAIKKKQPVRRDMDKRREQNRQSQKTYREKQRQRVQELERLAAASKPEDKQEEEVSSLPGNPPVDPVPAIDGLSSSNAALVHHPEAIDPSLLFIQPTPSSSLSLPHHISPANFLQVSGFYFPPDADVFFDCGCSTLHIPSPASPFLLPIQQRGFSLHANTLRLELECTLSALLKNCLHLGIPKSQFCADESESLFYRPLLPSSESNVEDEPSKLVDNTITLFRTVKHDLRPLRTQIMESHHPYIDVLPFRDLRENLVALQGRIDEDEFLHDWLNQATCWGGIKGTRGAGTPWEGRSWEVSEDFLRKWDVVVGGDEGELARGSRWWRSMRGEDVEKVV